MFCASNDIVLEKVGDRTKMFFSGGYQLERSRMIDMDKICAHRKFGSVCKFFQHLQNLFNSKKGKIDEISEKRINDKIHAFIGEGCCKQCSLNIATNIKDLFYIPFTSKAGYDDDTQRACNYFVSCLQCPPTANYIFNHSGLWKTFLMYQNALILCINGRCKLEIEKQSRLKNKFDSRVANITTNVTYRSLISVLLQVIRNIKFLKKHHWQSIVFHGEYFCEWLHFVQKQLEYGLFGNYPAGVECMYCFFILIAFGLYYIDEYHWLTIMEIKNMSVLDWFENIKNTQNSVSYNNFDLDGFQVAAAFISLGKAKNLELLHEKYVLFGKEVYDLKRNDVQCQYQLCNVRRKDICNGKLYKCKACRTARYCNKHCQKCDWSEHKMYCSKLQKSRKKYRNELKALKTLFGKGGSVKKWSNPLKKYTLKIIYGI